MLIEFKPQTMRIQRAPSMRYPGSPPESPVNTFGTPWDYNEKTEAWSVEEIPQRTVQFVESP